MLSLPEQQPARIRSFVRRQGRLTAGQQHALNALWPVYGLDATVNYDYSAVFARPAPLILEIGFGNGDSLAAMAQAQPEYNYLGCEVHPPGVGHLLLQIQARALSNVRIYAHDAVDILMQRIADYSLFGVQLFFPDPWHKTRHHKRRLVNPDFVKLLSKKLTVGGYFHAATDWQPYAEQMLEVLNAEITLRNTNPQQTFCSRPEYRPLTKFEQRGLRLGHGVWDLIFTKR